MAAFPENEYAGRLAHCGDEEREALKVLAFMCSLSLHYCGIDGGQICSVLEMLGVVSLMASIDQRIKDDQIVEYLDGQNGDNSEEIVRNMSLDGFETTVTIRYVDSRPMEMKIKCNELLGWTFKEPFEGTSLDYRRNFSLSVSSGILECRTTFLEKKEDIPSLFNIGTTSTEEKEDIPSLLNTADLSHLALTIRRVMQSYSKYQETDF